MLGSALSLLAFSCSKHRDGFPIAVCIKKSTKGVAHAENHTGSGPARTRRDGCTGEGGSNPAVAAGHHLLRERRLVAHVRAAGWTRRGRLHHHRHRTDGGSEPHHRTVRRRKGSVPVVAET
jgi:hypothetical protein